MHNSHLLLCNELDLLNKEPNNPVPRDLTRAVFPTPQCPNKRREIRSAGFEVGTNCLAKASLCPLALNRSRSSAILLCPYFNAVMSARMFSKFRTSMLQPAAHKHLKGHELLVRNLRIHN